MTATLPVPEISDVDMVFGGGAMKLLPAWDAIPKEFKDYDGTKWNKLVSDWFFHGVKNLNWTPKPGVSTAKAVRVLKCCIGSFEPKHEHKEAGCAYLLSQWFDDVTWDRLKAKK
jgi:hypothetical protein